MMVSDGRGGRQPSRQIGDITVSTAMSRRHYNNDYEEVSPHCAQAHARAGGSVRAARGLRSVRLQLVGEFQAGLRVGEWLTERTLRPRWNRVKGMVAPWGTELSQNAAKYAIIDLGQGAAAWGEYRGRVKAGQRAGRRVGFPKFKRRKHEQGFRADNGPETVRVDGRVVILPKVGRVAMVEELWFDTEVTVTGRLVRSIEDGQELPPVKEGPTIGVDVGVGTMAACSDGTMVENPKALAPALQRLRRLDKAVARSRNAHGESNHSNRRERLYAKRRRVHAGVVNVRSDNHHKATTAIAKLAGCVVVETLNVAGMMRNRRLARAIADAGMAGFLVKLEYKCRWYGAEYVKADRWFASSKLCARCGWKNEDLALSDREWWCGGCGVLNERDYNAALNLSKWPGLSFPVSGTWRLCKTGNAGGGR